MAPDVKETLERAVGGIQSVPDMDAILRRRNHLARNRTIGAALAAVVLLGGGGWLGSQLLTLSIPEIPPAERGLKPTVQIPPSPFPREVVDLPPGMYTSLSFEPRVTFEIPMEGQWNAFQDHPAVIDVGFRVPKPDRPIFLQYDLSIQRWKALVPQPFETNIDVSDNPAGWLQEHPFFEVRGVSEAQVAGRQTTLVVADVIRGIDRFKIARLPGHFDPASTVEFYFFEVDGVNLVALIRAPTRDFDDFASRARPILQTLRFSAK